MPNALSKQVHDFFDDVENEGKHFLLNDSRATLHSAKADANIRKHFLVWYKNAVSRAKQHFHTTDSNYAVSLIPQPPQPFAGPTYPPVLLQLVKALLWPPHHERGRKLEYSSNEQIPDVDPEIASTDYDFELASLSLFHLGLGNGTVSWFPRKLLLKTDVKEKMKRYE